MQKFSIEDPLYGSNITLLVGNTVKELNAWTAEHFGKDHEVGFGAEGNCSEFQCEKTGSKYYVVWLAVFDSSTNSHATLCHELMHLTFWILNNVGIKHVSESEEAFTYLFDCLVKQALTKINKRKKGKK